MTVSSLFYELKPSISKVQNFKIKFPDYRTIHWNTVQIVHNFLILKNSEMKFQTASTQDVPNGETWSILYFFRTNSAVKNYEKIYIK